MTATTLFDKDPMLGRLHKSPPRMWTAIDYLFELQPPGSVCPRDIIRIGLWAARFSTEANVFLSQRSLKGGPAVTFCVDSALHIEEASNPSSLIILTLPGENNAGVNNVAELKVLTTV